MGIFFKLYAIALPVFFCIDLLWIGVIAKSFYQRQIGHLMGQVNWGAAILFYLLFIGGMIVFVIGPAYEAHSWTRALLYGALFGLMTYATYDVTNFATMKDWPLTITIVDLAWGMVLTASVSFMTVIIAQYIKL